MVNVGDKNLGHLSQKSRALTSVPPLWASHGNRKERTVEQPTCLGYPTKDSGSSLFRGSGSVPLPAPSPRSL